MNIFLIVKNVWLIYLYIIYFTILDYILYWKHNRERSDVCRAPDRVVEAKSKRLILVGYVIRREDDVIIKQIRKENAIQ